MENKGTVSCLGPVGSHSELAAHMMCEGYEIKFSHNFAEAVKKLTSGEADCAVLPVENSLNGGVSECLDLLESEDIFGVREDLLLVDHRLALLQGVGKEEIDTVCSHKQALGQCMEYLETNFPTARLLETSSTTESLQLLNAHTAGIVGAHVRCEGVILSEENIADNKGNYTRFLLVKRAGTLPERSTMVFFSAVCAHKPGALVNLLKIFQRYSLNLTRIQSRPVKDCFGQYRFFIEIAGDIGNERVKAALAEARRYCSSFKLLGAYN